MIEGRKIRDKKGSTFYVWEKGLFVEDVLNISLIYRICQFLRKSDFPATIPCFAFKKIYRFGIVWRLF